MSLVPLLLFAQAYGQQILKFEGVRGIYQPDFTSCSERDRDTYTGIFQAGPLCIMKNDFSVTIMSGKWIKKGNRLVMRTEMFMERDLGRKPTDWSHDTFLGGLVFEPTASGDLLLVPGLGMFQKSKLTFRRIKPMTVLECLKLSANLDVMAKDSTLSLGYAAFSQLIDLREELAPAILEVLKSNESLKIRSEAAARLMNVHSETVVSEVGRILLQQDESKDHDKAVFRARLANTLSDTHLPSAFEYGEKAYNAKLISLSKMISIAGNSGNPKAVTFLKEASAGANENYLVMILPAMRKLSGTEALAFAQLQEKNSDSVMQFEILRTRAEFEPSPELRDKSVQALIDMFPKSEWMNQCDIAKSLGIAQTKLAHQGLLKVTGKGSYEAVQQWIDEALTKYKK